MAVTDEDRARYAAKSTPELLSLERSGNLTPDAQLAVMEELHRREQQPPRADARAAGAAAAGAAMSSAPPVAMRQPEDAHVAQALRELQAVLVAGEVLQAYAVQRRFFALTHRRAIVAATSGRFICMRRGLFGGFTPIDMRWQDIDEAKLRVGIISAELSITTLSQQDLATAGRVAGTIVTPGLRKEQAQAVYRVCQAQEQAWREKRRIRDLDELRARSGGMQIGSMGAGAAPDSGDPVARLQQAKEMLQNGLITDAEFESIKAKIVDRL